MKILLSLLIILLAGATTGEDAIKVTYLGNCGFFCESYAKKILLDPFGTKFGNVFTLPSDELTGNILNAKPPFEKVNLLLVSHNHGDHFDFSLAENFLLKNHETKMICPPQVYQLMKDSCAHFSGIEQQIISPVIAMDASKDTTINGIRLRMIRLQHGTNRSLEGVPYSEYSDYEKTENFGYVIHFDTKDIFFQGDADLKINRQALKQVDNPLAVAFLGYFDWDSTSYDIVKVDLKAENVVLMHATKSGNELQTEQFKNVSRQIMIFRSELESKTFE